LGGFTGTVSQTDQKRLIVLVESLNRYTYGRPGLMGEVRAPRGIGPAGRELWRAVAQSFELEDHELQILKQAAVVADRIAALDACVVEDGVIVEGGRANPALIESRLQRLALGRLIALLRLPDIEDRRPQHRAGFRGRAYQLRQVIGGA
jgi:hypothetical protein